MTLFQQKVLYPHGRKKKEKKTTSKKLPECVSSTSLLKTCDSGGSC